MASPLILKIQAELERRGFDDVKRQIDKLKKTIEELGDDFQETEKKSDSFLKNLLTFATITTVALVAVGVRQERVTAQLANSLIDIGVNADEAADSIQSLTLSMAENSLFSRGQLRESFLILAQSTGSLTLASGDLATAQEIALRANVSLETASKALALAHLGEGDALARLTGLTSTEIEEARELGDLRTKLAEKVPIGEATGRELATITGAIQRFTNQSLAAFTQVGEALFENFIRPFTTVGTLIIDKIAGRAIPDATRKFLELFGITVEETTQATLLTEQFDALVAVLVKSTDERRQGVETVAQEVAQLDLVDELLRGNLNNHLQILQAKIESGEATEEEIKLSNILRTTDRRQLEENVTRSRDEALTTQRTLSLLRNTSFREQVRIFESLAFSREDFQRRELQAEIQTLDAIKRNTNVSIEERRLASIALTNTRLQLLKVEEQAIVGGINKEIDARRRLFSLLQVSSPVVDETSSIEERGEALDSFLQLRNANLVLIERERRDSLAALRIDQERLNLTDREVESRRELIEAEALAREADARRDFEAGVSLTGDVPGRRSQREQASRQTQTVEREISAELRQQTRELEIQENLEDRRERFLRLIQEAREGGAQRGEASESEISLARELGEAIPRGREVRLERLISQAEEIEERLKEFGGPVLGEEESVEQLIRDVELQLQIPDINFNVNIDRPTLIEEMRAIVQEELKRIGFEAESQAPATSDIAAADITPGF